MFRNFLFDRRFLKTVQPTIFSIGVGNLSVGGTGKTPLIQYLIQLFQGNPTATLSRGYGRKTTGFREVLPASSAEEVGDEPMLFPRPGVRSFVSENRVKGWEEIRKTFQGLKLLLLDDVFQHRWIQPHRLLLLTTFEQPFFQDAVLPTGRLRERRQGAQRADLVLVTKCPHTLSEEIRAQYISRIRQYSSAPIFWARQKYGQPYDLWTRQPVQIPEKALAIAGIANPSDFFTFLETKIPQLKRKPFTDHHAYQVNDLESCFSHEIPIILTEKDAVKWQRFRQYSDKNIIVWPMEIEIDNQNEFDSLLLHWFGEFQSHS